MPRRVLLSTIAALCVLGVAGCSTTKPGVPAPAPGFTSATSAPSSSAPSSTAGTAGAADFTKQGSKLAINAKAVVPYKSSGKQGAVGITVTAIEKGSPADLAPLKLGAKADGLTPYYLRITVSNESGTPEFAYSSISSLRGQLADGTEAQGVSVIGKFEKCPNDSADKTFTTVGATYQTCGLALAPTSSSVTGATYGSGAYSDQAPNTDYSREPIIWK